MSRFITVTLIGFLGALSVAPDVSAGPAGGRGRSGGAFHRSGFVDRHFRHYGPRRNSYPVPATVLPAQSPVVDSEAPDPEPEPTPTLQTRRILRVKNDTSEKLEVYVQYRTQKADGSWAWYPADPQASTKAAHWTFEPGEEDKLSDNHWTVNASRIRIWAVSAGGSEWNEYKAQDFWLVPEDDNGENLYEADEMESYTFTFSN